MKETTVKLDDGGTAEKTAGKTVNLEPGSKHTLAFTNTLATGSLTITKRFDDRDVPMNEDEKNSVFAFKVTFTEDEEGKTPYVKSVRVGEEEKSLTPSGEITFELKAGESFTIKQLPIGVHYKVAETTITDGYTESVIDKSGNPGSTGVIEAERKNVAVTVINKKKISQPAEVSLVAKKKVEDVSGYAENYKLKAKQFEFKVTPTSVKTDDPITEAFSVWNDTDGNIQVFNKVKYTMPGTYTYTIREVSEIPDDGNFIDYDNDEHIITVNVTEVFNNTGIFTGELIATATIDDEAIYTFTNTIDGGETRLVLGSRKTVENLDGDEILPANEWEGKFTFELWEVKKASGSNAIRGGAMSRLFELSSDGGYETTPVASGANASEPDDGNAVIEG